MNDKHNEIIFDVKESSADAIAKCLKERSIVYLKNVFDPSILDYCSRAMFLNNNDLSTMLNRNVNFMPICFADRYIEGITLSEEYDTINLKSFHSPLSHSKMTKEWYYEGLKQYKLWFWQNGSRFPNLLLQAVARSKLTEIIRSYFGTTCISPYEHNALHYQRSDLKELFYPFHQDGSYYTREPKDHSGITIWFPFMDCGIDCPGLEVYPYKIDEILGLPKDKVMPYTFVDDNEVLERFGDKLWSPKVNAGDCLVFDNFLLHRTSLSPYMTKERQSADIRIFSSENIPHYANIYKGWLVKM